MVSTRSAAAASAVNAALASNTNSSPVSASASENTATFDSSSAAIQTLPGITVIATEVFDRGDPPQKKLPLEIQRMVFKELLVSKVPIHFLCCTAIGRRAFNYTTQGPELPEGHNGYGADSYGRGMIAVAADTDFRAYDSSLLAIASTCKAVKAQVLPIYYGENTFDFSSTRTLELFLKRIGRVRRELITSVTLEFQGGRRNNAFNLLATCRALKELKVTPTVHTARGGLESAHGLKALLKVKCARVVLKQRDGSGNFSKAKIDEVQGMMTNTMCVAKKAGYGGRRSTRETKEKNYEEVPEGVDDVGVDDEGVDDSEDEE